MFQFFPIQDKIRSFHNANRFGALATGLAVVLALSSQGWAKEGKAGEKSDPRPKRGSIALGQGKGANTDGAAVDRINSLFSKVVESVSPSVVSVTTEKKWSNAQANPNNPFYEFFGMPMPPQAQEAPGPKKNIPLGGGSGFVVSKEGYVFTNAHVIDQADVVKVGMNNQKTYTAKVIGVDKKSDVAVLKIDAKPEDLIPADFGDANKVSIGEWVLAIGNPFALRNTVTTGIVSAKGRRDQMGSDSYQDYIQTDAAVNPGNSGGPLVNLRGEVIGINSSIYTRTGGYMGVSFAIPINMAVKVAEDLIYEGKVIRGFLGIGIDNVSENLAVALGLQGTQGCLVREVTKGSPAEKGGLKDGDVILEAGGAAVADASDLRNKVADMHPGDKYEFKLLRNGKPMTLNVKVGAKADENDGDDMGGEAETAEDDGDGTYFTKKLGFHFGDITAQARQTFEIGKDLKGVLVQSVSDGSSAAENGFIPGLVITAYKRQNDGAFANVENAKSLLEALKSLKKGDRIAFKVWVKGSSNFVALKADE
jgi:serine protease Do